MRWVVSAGMSFQIVIHGQLQPTFLQRSFVGLRVHTGRLGWCKMPRVPVLAQRCGCCQVVVNWYWMLCHTQYIRNQAWKEQWSGTASAVSLSPPHFKCATTWMRLRASLRWVFSALMCSLKERCESHHSPRNFVDFSTGRSVSLILIVAGGGGGGGGGSLGFVSECSEMYNFTFIGCKPEPIPCCPFLYGIYCLLKVSMVSRERPRKQIARSSTKSALRCPWQ